MHITFFKAHTLIPAVENRGTQETIEYFIFLVMISKSFYYITRFRWKESRWEESRNDSRESVTMKRVSVPISRFHKCTCTQLGIHIHVHTNDDRCVMLAPSRCVMHMCLFVGLRWEWATFLEVICLIRMPLHVWCWMYIYLHAKMQFRAYTLNRIKFIYYKLKLINKIKIN